VQPIQQHLSTRFRSLLSRSAGTAASRALAAMVALALAALGAGPSAAVAQEGTQDGTTALIDQVGSNTARQVALAGNAEAPGGVPLYIGQGNFDFDPADGYDIINGIFDDSSPLLDPGNIISVPIPGGPDLLGTGPESAGTAQNNTAVQAIKGGVQSTPGAGNIWFVGQGLNGGTATGNAAGQFLFGGETAFPSETYNILQGVGEGALAKGNTVTQTILGGVQQIPGGFDRNFALGTFQGVGEGSVARDNTASQVIQSTPNPVDDGNVTSFSNWVIGQGLNGGTATGNTATQRTLESEGGDTVAQKPDVGPDARATFQGVGEGSVARGNTATMTVRSPDRHGPMRISQGTNGGTAIGAEATMDVGGAGHQLLIRQGAGADALARGSVATQKIRGVGHTAVIEQSGTGGTATQRIGIGSMPSLNVAN
jgi:hypothetical protein